MKIFILGVITILVLYSIINLLYLIIQDED